MIRYSSFEEVNAALSDLEELERRVSEKAHNEKYSDSEKTPRRTSSGTLSVNGQSTGNGTEENGEVHEDDAGETDSDSGSGTTENIGRDDDETDQDEVGESEDEYDDGRDPASDDDDKVRVRQKVAKVDPQEVADFDRELRALMQARFFNLFSIWVNLCWMLKNPYLYSCLVKHGGTCGTVKTKVFPTCTFSDFCRKSTVTKISNQCS